MPTTLLLARRCARDAWRQQLQELKTNTLEVSEAAENILMKDWSLDSADFPATALTQLTGQATALSSIESSILRPSLNVSQLPRLNPASSQQQISKKDGLIAQNESSALLSRELSELKRAFHDLQLENEQLSKNNSDQKTRIASLTETVKMLRREKDILEKTARASEIIPSKREREQLELLRTKVSELQQIVKLTEQKATTATERYKVRIDELLKNNAELTEEIALLEQDRAALSAAACAAELSSVVRKSSSVAASATSSSRTYGVKSNSGANSSKQSLPPLITPKPPLPTQHSIHDSKKLAPKSSIPKQQAKESSRKGDYDKSDGKQAATTHLRSVFVEGRVSLNALQEKLGILEPYVETEVHNAKLVREFETGHILSWYKNGTMKQKHSGSDLTKIFFNNGDFKETNGGRIVYWYAEKQILHTTFEDGMETVNFMESGQIEKHYPDGTQEILFKDSTVKYIYPNGEEKSIFPGGTIQIIDANGHRTVQLKKQ
ncbi:T-complex protein 10 C-terminus-domain-containing protein [Obelidium mucronatum]|nr:T-complex protein 10 C-terminus-domain-containing protein [Obelidium mucronatum]